MEEPKQPMSLDFFPLPLQMHHNLGALLETAVGFKPALSFGMSSSQTAD